MPIHFISGIEDKESFDKEVISHVISDKLSLRNQAHIHISINVSVDSLESESFIEYCETIFSLNKGFTLELNFNNKHFDQQLLNKKSDNLISNETIEFHFTIS